MERAFVDNAKVMAKGQITIPKDVRAVLGVKSGDRISFVVEGNVVYMVNSAIYAMKMLQSEMRGEAARAGFTTEEDVVGFVKELRHDETVEATDKAISEAEAEHAATGQLHDGRATLAALRRKHF